MSEGIMNKREELEVKAQIAQHQANILKYEARKLELEEKMQRLDDEIVSQAKAIKEAEAKLTGE